MLVLILGDSLLLGKSVGSIRPRSFGERQHEIYILDWIHEGEVHV